MFLLEQTPDHDWRIRSEQWKKNRPGNYTTEKKCHLFKHDVIQGDKNYSPWPSSKLRRGIETYLK